MPKKFLQFPDNFHWGVSTSSYQIEGGCGNNDWSHQALERNKDKIPWVGKVIENIPDAGLACDSWNRWREDIDLVKKANNKLYRLSLEWSRIEPEPGKFSDEVIARYREMIAYAKSQGIEVMITLHHFTNPIWIAKYGAWENGKIIKPYLAYARKTVSELGDLVSYWHTINEPIGYAYMSYILGEWVPCEKNNISKAGKVLWHMSLAHKRAYKLIHKIYREKFKQPIQVGIANDVQSYSNYRKHSLFEQLKIYFIYNLSNHLFYKLTGLRTHDFLSINYYFEVRNNQKGKKITTTFNAKEEDRFLTDAEWSIYPRGLYDVLYDLSDYKKPIMITENGIAAEDDTLRIRFIKEHLEEIYYAIKAGIDIRGYCHWSLLDNFEWAQGYKQKFGLIAVDPKTQNRTPKPSFNYYSEIAKKNGLLWEY